MLARAKRDARRRNSPKNASTLERLEARWKKKRNWSTRFSNCAQAARRSGKVEGTASELEAADKAAATADAGRERGADAVTAAPTRATEERENCSANCRTLQDKLQRIAGRNAR